MCIELDKPTIKIVSKPTPLLVPVFTLCALAPVVNELMRCLNVAPHDMREVLEIAKSSKDAVSTRFDGTSNWPNGAEKFRICYETFPQRVERIVGAHAENALADLEKTMKVASGYMEQEELKAVVATMITWKESKMYIKVVIFFL